MQRLIRANIENQQQEIGTSKQNDYSRHPVAKQQLAKNIHQKIPRKKQL